MTRQSIRRPSTLRLESLEPRDAPATLVSPTKLTYQDADGDNVAVVFSKPFLNAGNVNSIFTFDTGTVDGSNAGKQQLRAINLVGVFASAFGTSITLTATRSPVNGGDGFAAVGDINADSMDLGPVAIDGDLGRIDAGGPTPTGRGVKGLTVQSMGRYGTSTGAPDLRSRTLSKLDFLRVKSDFKDASIDAQFHGIGPVFIGGSLIGGAADGSGVISAGNLGFVTILGNVTGGAGIGSGAVVSGGKLAGVKVGGSVQGGTGDGSGRILTISDMGFATILGNVTGGEGVGSGAVSSRGKLAAVKVSGSVRGGPGLQSGRIASDANMGFVTILGDLVGGGGGDSGEVNTVAKLAGAKVGGSVVGGAATFSGRITSNSGMGFVTVRGDLVGGPSEGSGRVDTPARLAGVTVGGSVRGGAGGGSGQIDAAGDMGFVTVLGSLTGADGFNSGTVIAEANLAGARIGGSMYGATGDGSGRIIANLNMGPVTILGSVIGGTGQGSGQISAGGTMTGAVVAGDVVGGSASGTANLTQSGFIRGKHIASLTIGGSLIAGTDTTSGFFQNNGAIKAGDDIGSLLIKGSVVGNASSPALIYARGSATPTATTDVAIGSLRVLGRVEFGKILAGVLGGEIAINADAQIGLVSVGGDWIASSIAAGAIPGPNGFYGDGDDARMSGTGIKDNPSISSRIGSVAIGGQVIGTVGGADHFGIVAEVVGAVKVGGTPLPLTAGKDDIAVGITGDFEVNEV